MKSKTQSALKQSGLKNTEPRRAVFEILSTSRKPLSPQMILERVRNKGHSIGIVTVYRVIEAFERVLLVHRHPAEGLFSLCTLPGVEGHHILMHCDSCGRVEEAHDDGLCMKEEALAAKKGFHAVKHLNELIGFCSLCSPR